LRRGRRRLLLGLDQELQDFAHVHQPVALRHLVERAGPVEDATGLDPPSTFSIRTSPAPYITVALMPALKQHATAGDRPC
jgi:hypothetical protein